MLTKDVLEENVFWYDLSVGFLISYIFYVLLELIPEYMKLIKAKRILYKYINLILEDLNIIIHIIFHVYGLNIEKKDMAIKKLIKIDGNVKVEQGFYNEEIYKKQFLKKFKRISGIETTYEFPNTVINRLEHIDKQIEKIFQVENFYSSDANFLECIVNIKENKLISWYSTRKNGLFIFANTSEELYKLIRCYYKLLEMNYYDKKYTIKVLTKEEILKRPDNMSEFFKHLRKRNEKFNSYKPCIIYDDRIEDNVFLVESLTNNKNIKLVNQNQLNTYDINSNHNLIIIVLNHKFQKNNDYNKALLRKKFKDKYIVILKPYIFYYIKVKNKIWNEGKNKYIVPFKISFKLLNLYINRECPLRNTGRNKAIIDEIIDKINEY